MPEEWNSIGIAWLAIEALTPIAVVILGLLVARGARRLEHLEQANQTVVARRVSVFGEIAVKLNQILCFATFVGRWKEIRPTDVLILKREVDEVIYANKLIFSDEVFDAYHAFMASIFSMYATIDGDALIRAGVSSSLGDRRRLIWWSSDMAGMFDIDNATPPIKIQSAYERLSAAFRADVYVTELTRRLL